MFSIQNTTPAGFSAVPASDLRDWLRLNDTSEDTVLANLCGAAAEDQFANDTGCVLCQGTYKLYLDHWPTTYFDFRDQPSYSPYAIPFPYAPLATVPALAVPMIFLPRRPVQSVSLVEYLDTDGTWQTLTGWTSDIQNTCARIALPQNLPTTHQTQKPTVRVTFSAGYAANSGSLSSIPPLAVMAVKLLAAHYYNHREAYTDKDMKEVPMGYLTVCKRFATGIKGNWNA